MKERFFIILILALVVMGGMSYCSNQLISQRMDIDYQLAIQPDSIIDRLDQNRASIVETAKPRMSGSTIVLLTLIPILLLAGFAVFATYYEKIVKQTRLLMKKKKRFPQTVQNVPLLEEGVNQWLD